MSIQEAPRQASAHASSGDFGPARVPYNPWLVLGVVCLGFFMILLDTTIVNIAVPSIVDAVNASFDDILWVIDAYVLVYAVLLITAGRLGDMYGQRTLFAIGLAVFTIASAVCGQAQNTSQLIAARMAQGVGGALLTPQSLAIITTIFPPNKRGAAFGVWGSIAGLAAISGPTIGGLLVTTLGWRWIFYVNVPIGIIALTAVFLVMPDLRPGRRHQLDVGGVVLATTGLLGIIFGLIEGERFKWSTVWGPITIPMLIGLGVLIMVLFGFWERRQPNPLIPGGLLKIRNFVIVNWIGATILFAVLGFYLPFTIYLQSALGLTALQAGIALVPMEGTGGILAPFVGSMVDRVGGKFILMGGLLVFAAGIALVIAVASPTSTGLTFLLPLVVGGLGEACIWGPSTAVAMREVEPRMAGAASGLLNTSRQIGGVLGSAIVGALLQNRLAAALYDQAVAASSQVPEAFRAQLLQGFASAGQAGLDVGPTQQLVQLPPGTPPAVAQQLQGLFHQIFSQAFVIALRPSLAMPVLVLVLAGLTCVFIRRRDARTAPWAASATGEAVASAH